jgi:hypothetical protein
MSREDGAVERLFWINKLVVHCICFLDIRFTLVFMLRTNRNQRNISSCHQALSSKSAMM